MAVRAVIPFLVAMMLVTGVCNTLLTKLQDKQCVRNCKAHDPRKRAYFEQPVLQTAQMFIGEMGCWLVVGGAALLQRWRARGGYERLPTTADGGDRGDALIDSVESEIRGDYHDGDEEDDDEPNPMARSLTLRDDEGRLPMTGWRVALLALPACADITGTTLMNIGLLFVAASIYQMTRGALVLFVGLFSVVFLKRTLGAWKWFSLVVVVLGVAVVGLAGALDKGGDKAAHGQADGGDGGEEGPDLTVQTVVGVLLIALAQIFTATQFVLEESIMERYSIEPLKAVGWEGTWGFVVTAVGMLVLHFAYGRTDAGRYGYFDAHEGLRQMFHYPVIAISSVLIMISIGGFNFFGLSVTRTVSATARSTIDTCRTLFIWIVSLGLGWESFKWLQVVGFALLVYGTFLFNDIMRPPLQSCLGRRKARGELLPEALGEHR